MRAVEILFVVGWAAFWGYWVLAAFTTKRGHHAWGREIRIRILLVAAIVILARLGVFHDHRGVHSEPWRMAVGLVLFAAGLLFAVWARVHIGHNWGTPMTRREQPELVTSGPYHLVRHPIYSGIIAAGLGTAIALSWFWLAAVGLGGMYFIYSATVEETFLAEQFPGSYPAYKRSTKMLIPFIL